MSPDDINQLFLILEPRFCSGKLFDPLLQLRHAHFIVLTGLSLRRLLPRQLILRPAFAFALFDPTQEPYFTRRIYFLKPYII